MVKIIRQLFSLLTTNQKKRFYILQILVVIMAFMEIIGVASIIPFMALVGDISQLQQDTFIAYVFKNSGIKSEAQFIFFLGIGVLIMLLISSIISMFTAWRLALFAAKVGAEISERLYTYYLKQDWLFHASGSSAGLTKKIHTEAGRVTGEIVMPLLQMNARFVLVLFMSLTLFIYDPLIAIIGIIIFAISYLLLFKVVRMSLQRNGIAISESSEERFRIMNESFGGIKDLLLLGRDNYFTKLFHETSQILAYSLGANTALTQIPRYLIELVAFGSMIALLLYLIATNDGNLGLILPILSVYALATFKLLPAFQQLYASLAQIKGSMASFESIHQDLADSAKISLESEQIYLNPKENISLKNITFTYPNKKEAALNQLDLLIQVNSVVGIVGPSGSGKSTLIDVLLGLIQPQKGNLMIDGKVINDKNRRHWQNTIGFVAQNIFLSEGTIANNVAFGIPQNRIDLEKVKYVLNLAQLSELIETLEHGIHTKVGERGVQISGGQRQRIGIARALYNKAEVLVFDEATSSLDGITEKTIMESIHHFGGNKTIIMIAHRLKTVQKCDQIFFINQGQVEDRGSYQELLKRNEHFKKMAAHS